MYPWIFLNIYDEDYLLAKITEIWKSELTLKQ